jgi:hypothetical protein
VEVTDLDLGEDEKKRMEAVCLERRERITICLYNKSREIWSKYIM